MARYPMNTSIETREWVSVEERLPEAGIHTPNGWIVFDGKRVYWLTWHPSWWNHKDERGSDFDGPKVTHWMPLPSAPIIETVKEK